MKFKFHRKKHHSAPRKKELPRVKTSSILLRRNKGKEGRNEVVYHGQTQRELAVLGLARKVLRHVKVQRKVGTATLQPSDEAGHYNPFLLNIGGSGVDHCVARLRRREVLFARGVAGLNKRNSPGQGGTYKPSQGPCERRT